MNSTSAQPISLSDLKEQFKTLKAEFDKGLEYLTTLQDILKVLKSAQEDPSSCVYSVPDIKKFFFEEYIGGITKRLTQIKFSQNHDVSQLFSQPPSFQYLQCAYEIILLLGQLFVENLDKDNADFADSMRCLFDHSSPLHQNIFQSEEKLLSNNDPNLFDRLSPEEQEWRLSLKEGSLIDAVKVEEEYQLKQWSKGVITNMIANGKYFQVQFENDFRKYTKDFTIYSSEIARYNTRSAGDEWRKDLKAGSIVDGYDTTKVWYTSTIIDSEVKMEDSQEIPCVKLAFRQYHPEGNKLDMKQERFYGWSETFDEWPSAYNPRIQQYQTFTKMQDYLMQTSSSDEACDDHLDSLQYPVSDPSKIVYATARKRCKSILLVQFLNQFGSQGGFEKLLERIRDENIGLDIVFYYVDCIASSMIMLTRPFFTSYAQDFVEAVKSKILNANDVQLRNIKKDRMDQLVNLLIHQIKARFLNMKQRDVEKNLLNIQIGSVFLESNFMERRIDGAKLIHEVCKSINNNLFSQTSESIKNNSTRVQQQHFIAEVIQKIKENNIIVQFFSKERTHLELVQRSEELLKLLMGQGALSNDELDQVWSCTKRGEEAIKLQMYKVCVEIASKMRGSDIAFIIEQLSSKSTAPIKEEIELVHEMARRTTKIELGKIAVEYLWKISMESNDKLDKNLVNQAALSFSDIIKYWTIENKIQYVERLLKNMSENKQGYQSIKNLIRIFKDFINYNSNARMMGKLLVSNSFIDDINSEDLYSKPSESEHSQDKTEEAKSEPIQQQSQSLLDYVNKKHDILSVFFSNFKNYMERVRDSVQKRIDENPLLEISSLADSCLIDKFCHSDQVCERLEFLKFVSGNSHQIMISQQMLNILWDELATSLIQNDQEIFFKWLREAVELHSEGACIIEIPILVAFFKNKMIRDSKTMQYITPEGFNCIQSLFILMNEQEKKIIKLNSSQSCGMAKITSYSNNNGSSYNQFSFNLNKPSNSTSTSDPDDFEISVLVHPQDLEGIEGIWKIAVNSSDIKIGEKATQLLIKLYTNIAYRNEQRIPEFEDSYIKQCIDGINEQVQIINQRTEELHEETMKVERQLTGFSMTTQVTIKVLPLEERKIVKYLSLIKELIKNSEKEGTHGVKPHSALFKGEYLHTLQVNNSLKNGNKYSTKIELGCYSNTTLWELRKLIGERVSFVTNLDGTQTQELPVHPSSIRLYRYTGSVDLKDYENGRTLAELRFKPNESLSAFKKNTFNASKEPLLNEFRTDMSDRAKAIFEEWFYIFSEEDPDLPGHRVMTPKTCAAFARTCTDDHCTEEDNRVVGLFAMYDKDRDMKIQKEDFLLFYKNCCTDKEEVVRQNLYANGYRYDLRRNVRDTDPEFIMQVRKSIQEMPRYKISNVPSFFETIFSLLEKQGEVSSQAWNLIKNISTNPSLYWKVLKLDKSADFQWDQIFDSSSIYKMLYSLQIVESLLELNPTQLDTSTEEGQLKADWIQRFLELDGFQQILILFHKSIDILSGKSADTLNKFEKNFLEFMLRLIKIFMMAAVSQNSQQNAFNIISLAKKSSSIKEQQIEANPVVDQEAYKTPSKQFKPTVQYGVAGPEAKQLYADYQPEITEESLFPEQETLKPEPGQEVKDESKNESSSAGKKEEGQRGIEEEMERFAQLVNVMKNTGLGERILERIDFKELQDQVLEIVCILMNKKEVMTEDKQIIENALSLWVASVIRNENLIDDFYNYQRSEEKAGKYGIRNAEQFILSGIYCYKNFRVREEIANTLQIICSKVKNNQGRPLLFYVLNLLKNNFPKEDQYYATRECKQFFDLFSKLVDEYFNFGHHPSKSMSEYVQLKVEFESDAIDACELLREVVEKLKRHETKEKKTSILEDKTLCGYLELILKLINYISEKDKTKMVKVLKDSLLLHELFYENLFYEPNLTKSSTGNKCKTKESRQEAFKLLARYIQCLEPSDMADFMEQYLWPLMKDVKKPKKWCYTPNDSQRNSQFVGIVNLGCICYMNSMLQQFFMVPAFRYQLLRAIDKSPEDIVEYKGNHIDDSMLRQLQKLFGFLELSERAAYDPTEFCFSFKDIDGLPTNTALQQDAQEFLSIFFDRVEELLRPTSQKHLLEDVFGFKLCSQLICQSCGNIRNLLESQYTLSLQVKDRKGMEDSLHKMIEGSIINDFQCEACNQRVDVFKRNLIAETPNVLIVHLQRIVFNFDTFQNDKINSRFEFPNVLSLKDFSFREVMKSENRPNDIMYSPEMKHLMSISDEEYTYKLVGVNIHIGTAEYGHYYSLINTKRGSEEVDESKVEWTQTEKDSWKQFEDDKIKIYSFSDLRVDSFGGSQQANMNDNEMNAYLTNTGGSFGKNAYMLVYERMKKKQLTEIITESELQQVSASLDCANTATSRAASENTTRQLDFRKVTPYVPQWIKDKVNEDNANNLIDQHIFSEGFFNMVKQVFKHIADHVLLTQHRYALDHIPYFNRIKKTTMKIARKSMFDLLAYFFQNTQMNDITSSFGSIIQFCDSTYSLTRGDESLLAEFIKEQYLADNCQSFLNLMFNCTDKTSRFYIGKMTSQVVNKAFQICELYNTQFEEEKRANPDLVPCPRIKDLQESVEKLLDFIVIALQTSECQKNWMRLENFLKMIHEIGTGGTLQVHCLLTKFDIVVDLIDFMLGNKSPLAIQKGEKRPNMGAGMSSPPFESVVALASYLIRWSLTPEMKKEQRNWNSISNPQPITLLGYSASSNHELEGEGDGVEQDYTEKYPLSETAVTFFTLPEFMDKVLKEGYECEEFGKAIAHFCYKNEHFTKRVCKMLLKGISKNDYEKIKNYLDVVTQVSLIKDEFQRIRLEWIFGISLLNSQSVYTTFNAQMNSTKLGIQCMDSLTTDEVFSFKSSLLPLDSDDALLNLLWRYKGRIDSYTVSCLQSLVNLLALDENIAEYFAQLPGPTYSYARYTDWIKPYLHEQLLDARKGYHGSLSQSKEETVIKVLSLYEKYEKFLLMKDKVPENQVADEEEGVPLLQENDTALVNKIEEPAEKLDGYEIDEESSEENVKNLINENTVNTQQNNNLITTKVTIYNEQPHQQQTVLHCEPRPYVIIECLKEEQSTQNDFDGVVLNIAQLSCLYTPSYPTGKGNLSIHQIKNKQGRLNVRSGQIVGNNRREQEMQNRCVGNQFQSAAINKPHQKELEEKQKEIPSTTLKVIQDENDQWRNVDIGQQNSDSDRDDRNNMSDDEQKNYGPFMNRQWDQNDGVADVGGGPINYSDPEEGLPQTFQIKVVEQQDEESASTNIIFDVEAHPHDEGNAGNQQNLGLIEEEEEEKDEVNWPYGVHMCPDLVYKIYVTNNRENSVKCYLKFQEYENQSADQINLHWPRGGLKAVVYPHQTKTLIILPKIVPANTNEEEGVPEMETLKLNTSLFWKQKESIQSNQQVAIYPQPASASQVSHSRRQGMMVQSGAGEGNGSGGVKLDLLPVIINDSTVYSSEVGVITSDNNNAVTAPSGFKSCPTCTMFNQEDEISCEICGHRFT